MRDAARLKSLLAAKNKPVKVDECFKPFLLLLLQRQLGSVIVDPSVAAADGFDFEGPATDALRGSVGDAADLSTEPSMSRRLMEAVAVPWLEILVPLPERETVETPIGAGEFEFSCEMLGAGTKEAEEVRSSLCAASSLGECLFRLFFCARR